MITPPKDRKTYSLPKDLTRKVAKEAHRAGRPESAVVRDALERYFAEPAQVKMPRFVGMGQSATARDPAKTFKQELAEMLLADYDRAQEEWLRERGQPG